MQASTSYRKIKNWLLICMAMVDVIENHKQFIYNLDEVISLNSILETVYGSNSKKLISYVEERKALFSQTDLTASQEVILENKDYQENELDNDFKMKNL